MDGKFLENGLDKLFQPLHEEILRIFEEEYEKVLKPHLNEQLISGQNYTGIMSSGNIQYHRKTSIFDFFVEPQNNQAYIVFKATKETFTVT